MALKLLNLNFKFAIKKNRFFLPFGLIDRSSMSQIELNKKNCDELLKKFVEISYKNAKTFTIKDGALISKCFRIISNVEKDEKITDKLAYETLFKVLEVSNIAGVFSFDDAAALDIIMEFLKKDEKGSQKKNVDISEIVREVKEI